MKAKSLLAASALALAAVAAPAQAGGDVVVVNETDTAIHPWFRYNCWGFILAPTSDWIFFGGIGARGQFGWDFSDPALTDPACPKPRLEFTYTIDPDVATPPAKTHNKVKMKFNTQTNFYMQLGENIKSFRLGDNEGDDD
jgi:hypothetical protein